MSLLIVGAAVLAALAGVLLYRLRHATARAEEQRHEYERLTVELAARTADADARSAEAASLAAELEELNRQLMLQTSAANRALQRSRRLQRFTANISALVGAGPVARAIVDEGRRSVEASAAAVAVLGDDGVFRFLASHGYPEELLDTRHSVYDGPSPLRDVVRGGDPVWIADRAELAERYPLMAEHALPEHCAWAALPLDASHRRVGVMTVSFDRSDRLGPEERAFMLLLAQQCAQALERARLHELEVRARVNAEFAERRLAFLADVSTRLAVSLDYLTTLANLAQAAVPEIADWCMVHLIDDDSVPRLIAAVHGSEEKAAFRRALEERYPPGESASIGYARVFRTGEPEFFPVVTDDHLRAATRDGEHLEAIRSLGVRSQLSVPIKADDVVCGVLTLANAESGRIFAESDLTLAVELGLRAGQAVQNARLYQAAHHASEAKSDFLAVMSHELRTPLNAIIGYSDLLLLGVPDDVPERARRQVERIRSASTTLLHLVEEVLSFSRVEAGKEDIRISPVDLTTVVRECVQMVEPLAQEKHLVLSVEEDRDRPVKVVTDERKVRQILTNLLSNAVKFTETGTVTVRAVRETEEVRIDVADSGIGISPEHLERIFEPFWQVEQSATRRYGGTGLGLGVARKLARLLEGRLDVRSEVGRGSTFTLVLPLRTPGMQRQG